MKIKKENEMRGLSEMMLVLFQGALEKTVGDFKEWAFGELHQLISFDAAMWATGAWVDGRPLVHQIHGYHLSTEFSLSWMRHLHEDRLIRNLTEQTTHTFNINVRHEYGEQPVYLKHYKPYGMEHILASAATHPETRLLNVICIYRADVTKPFDETMRQRKELLYPHLIEAARTNWGLHVSTMDGTRRDHPHAACDSLGLLHIAMPAFVGRCKQEWPNWKGPFLPDELIDALSNNRSTYRAKQIAIDICAAGELTLLRARSRSAVDNLTTRELDTARLFADGMDHKMIAKELGISPTTVRTHLARVYSKLRVKNKVRLAAELAGPR
jgi:DNA-binding CsgD family transcriptional regulator